MALRLPESRPPAPPQLQRAPVPIDQIVQVMGQNPYANALDRVTPLIAQAFQRRNELRKQAAANQIVTKSLGIDVPEGTDLSHIPTENLLQMAQVKAQAEKANQFDFAGLSGDQKNMIVLNKRTGSTELRPLPEGFSPKNPPKPQGPHDFTKSDEDNWIKLGDKVNSLNASSRHALGVAATANMRADRALNLLDNPNATPEDKQLIVTDLLGIMKGGTPDEQELRRGMYGSYHEGAVNFLTKVLATPQALNQPQIMQKLKETVLGLKSIDNKIINDNLGIESVAFEGPIKRNPDRWGRMMSAVNATTVPPSLQPLPVPGQGGWVETPEQRKARLIQELARSR